MKIEELDAALQIVAPIDGVVIGDPLDRATWRIDFALDATLAERELATALMLEFNPPASSPFDIKAECRRRILLIMTEDQQRNTLAAGQAAVMQYGADPAAWPPELQTRQGAAMIAWAEIERLRARSDAIELLEPIPADLSDDALWVAA